MRSPQPSVSSTTTAPTRAEYLAAESGRLSRLAQREAEALAHCRAASEEHLRLQQLIVTMAVAIGDEAAAACRLAGDVDARGVPTGRPAVIPPLRVLRERARARLAAMAPVADAESVALAG